LRFAYPTFFNGVTFEYDILIIRDYLARNDVIPAAVNLAGVFDFRKVFAFNK